MARTIDNLGVETSTRYATDRAIYDESFGKEASFVLAQTTVTSTSPHSPLEFDTLFQLGDQGVSWASFISPPKYAATRRRLFAEQTIPQLGSPEKREAQLKKLEAYGTQEKEGHPQEKEAIEKEKHTFLSLLKQLSSLDQLLFDFNSRREQYKKG